jgi:hypothetical protein
MSVPAATPLAKAPEPGGSGSLRLACTAAVVVGIAALAVTLGVQIMPRTGKVDPTMPAIGKQPGVSATTTVTHMVIYELLGEHGVRNVTYVADGAAIVQEREAATPWSKSFQRTGVEGGREFYSVSAQNAGPGTLRCRIIVDGRVVGENSVAGDRAMVTCVR